MPFFRCTNLSNAQDSIRGMSMPGFAINAMLCLCTKRIVVFILARSRDISLMLRARPTACLLHTQMKNITQYICINANSVVIAFPLSAIDFRMLCELM